MSVMRVALHKHTHKNISRVAPGFGCVCVCVLRTVVDMPCHLQSYNWLSTFKCVCLSMWNIKAIAALAVLGSMVFLKTVYVCVWVCVFVLYRTEYQVNALRAREKTIVPWVDLTQHKHIHTYSQANTYTVTDQSILQRTCFAGQALAVTMQWHRRIERNRE